VNLLLKSKITVSTVSIILAASLIANAYLGMQQCSFTTHNDTLQKQAAELSAEINNLQNENTNLQSQLIQLDGPKLVTRLGAADLNYQGQDIRLYLYGEVWNVGTSAAQNSKLHVTLYIGNKVTNDTYIELGTINAGSFVNVASNIYYASGNALTNWTIVPEYD
jgi:hypothetical protein